MLDDLKRSLRDFQPTQLSDQRFDVAHEWFEGQSNQQAQILDWLQCFATHQMERREVFSGTAEEPFRILSVGCGSGILDLPLIQFLIDRIEASDALGTIDYTGIDPNPVACDRFRSEFKKWETSSTTLSVLEETVESYRHTAEMNLTHVVHSMYYFTEPAASLKRLMQHLAEDGELVIFQAPKGELNRLADCFWQTQGKDPIWFSEDLERHLQESDVVFARSRLDAEVDVTDCFDSDCPKGRLTFDFLVQSDCKQLSSSIRGDVLDHLRSISRIDDGKILAPHPVDAFVIQSAKSQIHRDASTACSP